MLLVSPFLVHDYRLPHLSGQALVYARLNRQGSTRRIAARGMVRHLVVSLCAAF